MVPFDIEQKKQQHLNPKNMYSDVIGAYVQFSCPGSPVIRFW